MSETNPQAAATLTAGKAAVDQVEKEQLAATRQVMAEGGGVSEVAHKLGVRFLRAELLVQTIQEEAGQ